MPLPRVVYRTRQFLQALSPGFEERHLEPARAVLDDGELALFESMEVRDMRHGLRVMQHLKNEHHADRDLLAAALLHDCGKGHVPVWLRVAYVVVPGYVRGLAREPGSPGTAGAAYRLVHHATLGAALAAAAGSSVATVRYISGSVTEREHDKIALLRAADDRS